MGNLAVADALAYTPATGPTIADVTTIRDSINIINAQAAQRYIARVALAANSPGNGMGGSSKRVTVTSPGADDGNTNTNNYPTACGGGMYKTLFGTPGAVGNGGPTLAAADGGSGTISSVANPTNPTATSLVNAPCGTTATASGTFTSNTGLVKTVMNEVKMATVAKLPYTIEGAAYGAAAGTNGAPADAVKTAVSNKAVIAATRGELMYNTEAGYYKKKTPIACIGPSVVFNSIQFVAIAARDDAGNAARSIGFAFCDPRGLEGPSKSSQTLFENAGYYSGQLAELGNQVEIAGTDQDTYSKIAFGATTAATDITNDILANYHRVWDPVIAAQLTEGAMCCNAEYFSADGVGRAPYESGDNTENPGSVANPTDSAAANPPPGPFTGNLVPDNTAFPEGTGDISEFEPPLSGGDMSAAVSPGTMCPQHGSGNGQPTTASVIANVKLTNPKMKEYVEGQAFYAAFAPSQYSLPTTSTTEATQTARANKQKKCAEEITQMMKLNKIAASEASATKFGFSYSAINFPLWRVAIGTSPAVADYTVPNGYCYANACIADFANIGTQSTFKGSEKLGELVSGPNMASAADGEACGRANGACAAPPAA